MREDPREEHRWLQERMIGEWRFEWEEPSKDGGPPVVHSGREVVRAHGDLWVVAEGTASVGDATFLNLITLGFDAARERWVGTFVGSNMTHLWRYEGARDGDALVLESEGPRFDDTPGTGRYRDTYEMRGDDVRLLSSSTFDEASGEWRPFMTLTYTRVVA